MRQRSTGYLLLAMMTLGVGLPTLSADFSAAYVHPGDHGPELTLLPMVGPESTVPLPQGLSGSLTVNAFSTDGKAIYVQDPAMDGIRKIEIKPTRQSIVRGTAGVGAIWHFNVSQPSGSVVASGIVSELRGTECGTFKIDPDFEGPRKLLTGAFPDCGGGGGAVSPDGTRVLGYSEGNLCVTQLVTGAVEVIQGLKGLGRDDVTWKGQVAWSPDGKWIAAAVEQRRLVLIDTKNLSRQRKLGSSGDGRVVWSPDSRHLLLQTSQFRCALSVGYFQSLEVLDVETGNRSEIKSSQCKISGGFVGWIDPEAIR
jgi:hypothetical protein